MCKFCPAGYQYISTIASCTQCAVGQFQASMSTLSVACQSCTVGMHQPAVGQSSCIQNVCTCNTNGQNPKTGADCTTHNAVMCAGCPSGEILESTVCIKCTARKAASGIKNCVAGCWSSAVGHGVGSGVKGCTACA